MAMHFFEMPTFVHAVNVETKNECIGRTHRPIELGAAVLIFAIKTEWKTQMQMKYGKIGPSGKQKGKQNKMNITSQHSAVTMYNATSELYICPIAAPANRWRISDLTLAIKLSLNSFSLVSYDTNTHVTPNVAATLTSRVFVPQNVTQAQMVTIVEHSIH